MSLTTFGISFDGCPYVFATAGCPTSVTSTDTDWSSAWTVLPDTLDQPELSWDERLATLDGQFQCGGLTFTVHDHPVTTGLYAGQDRIASYLFTRRPSRIARQAIASPGYTTGAGSFNLASTVGMPSGDVVVWIDQEAMLVNRTGSVVSVTTAGYYGSRGTNHLTDDERGFAPVVWSAFPGITRRRVILWMIEDGVATPIWRGRAMQTPTLSDDGETYSIQCEHAWTWAKDCPVGVNPTTTRIFGYPSLGPTAPGINTVIEVHVKQGTAATINASSVSIDAGSAEELFAELSENLRASLAAGSLVWFERVGDGVRMTYVGSTSDTVQLDMTVKSAGDDGRVVATSVRSVGSTDSGGVRTATCEVDKFPEAFITGAATGTTQRTLLVDTTYGLPASSGSTTTAVLPDYVVVRLALRGKVSDDWNVVFDSYATDTADSTVTGRLRFEPRRPKNKLIRGDLAITQPTELSVVGQVVASHWLQAIRYGLLNTVAARVLRNPVDSRDWTWGPYSNVLAATGNNRQARSTKWYFDGSQKFGDTLTDQCRLNGCAVSVREGGRLSIVALRPPLPTDAIAATFTDADYIEDPQYQALPEGVANTARVESEQLTIVANDLRSEGLYGPGRELSLKLFGRVDAAPVGTPSAVVLAQLLRFLLGTWGDPTELHTLTVSLDYLTTVYGGDYVTFDSVVAPDGAGSCGLTSQRGQVIGRTVDLTAGTIALAVLVYANAERRAGLAPAIKVSSIASDVIYAQTEFVGTGATTTDYAGSSDALSGDALPGYRYTPDDGGVSWFAPGDKVRLVTRDETTMRVESGLEVLSVDAGAGTITLTASVPTSPIDWDAFVTGGGWADLVPETYSNAATAQRDFAYVGSEAAQVIDGTADSLNRFAA